MKTRRKRGAGAGTAFVPRVVFQTLFAGVVPAVAAGCGSTAMPNDGQVDTAPDQQIITLAMIGFDADAGRDASIQPDSFGVADIGFDAGRRDEGIIVLAQIGFEIDPNAVPEVNVVESEPGAGADRTVAQAAARASTGARRASRRGRA